MNRSPSLKEVYQPGEGKRDFRIRMQQLLREKWDEMMEALRNKYATKIASLQERLRKAQATVQKQQEPARQAKMQTALSFGSTLLGAFTGRKALSSAARRAGRANETVESVQQQLTDLQTQFDTESAALTEKLDPLSETLETISVRRNRGSIP